MSCSGCFTKYTLMENKFYVWFPTPVMVRLTTTQLLNNSFLVCFSHYWAIEFDDK